MPGESAATNRLVVLDASAMLAVLQAEAGHARVAAALGGALVSAVNLAEVVSKLRSDGLTSDEARLATDVFADLVVAFDAEQAHAAGDLRPATRRRGLSLGDRACLALAAARGGIAMTTDRAWADLLDVGVRVEVVR